MILLTGYDKLLAKCEFMKKVGRNDPCPCGSGKKFKKCCENKMIGKRFMAQKLSPDSTQGASKLSSLFQQKVTDTSQQEIQPKKFEASFPKKEEKDEKKD